MKGIYDGFLQFIANTSWGQFIAQAQAAQNPEGGTAVRDIFQQDLYLYAFVYLIICTVLALIYYYFILNRKNGSGFGFQFKYWIYTFLISAALLTLVTTGTCYALVNKFLTLYTFKFCLGLGAVNAIYLIITYFVGSYIVKRFSVANRTPF
jgi:hypothetical protein